MKLEVSPAEVLDRWSILELKRTHIKGAEAQASIERQLSHLAQIWRSRGLPSRHDLAPYAELQAINAALWDTEDALRDHESRQDFFDESFIALARSVYQLNDRRSMAKRAINELLDVAQDEWKSYGG